MESHIVKVLKAYYVTHDVKCFVVEKPEGYDFIPGQGTNVSINLPEWKDQLRPFTFTSLRENPNLEFMIKIYMDHAGVTKKVSEINAGGELILHEVFGAIQYKGSGDFLDDGSGITPFIAIYRVLDKNEQLEGKRMIYYNNTSEASIMEEELQVVFRSNYVRSL